jgi:hypothetical protein
VSSQISKLGLINKGEVNTKRKNNAQKLSFSRASSTSLFSDDEDNEQFWNCDPSLKVKEMLMLSNKKSDTGLESFKYKLQQQYKLDDKTESAI